MRKHKHPWGRHWCLSWQERHCMGREYNQERTPLCLGDLEEPSILIVLITAWGLLKHAGAMTVRMGQSSWVRYPGGARIKQAAVKTEPRITAKESVNTKKRESEEILQKKCVGDNSNCILCGGSKVFWKRLLRKSVRERVRTISTRHKRRQARMTEKHPVLGQKWTQLSGGHIVSQKTPF